MAEENTEQNNPAPKGGAESRIEAFLAAQYPLALPDAKSYRLDAIDVVEPTPEQVQAVAAGTAVPTSWAMASAARAIINHDSRFAKVLFGVEESRTVQDVGPDDELIV